MKGHRFLLGWMMLSLTLGVGAARDTEAQIISPILLKKGPVSPTSQSVTERSSLYCLARSGADVKKHLDTLRGIPGIEVIDSRGALTVYCPYNRPEPCSSQCRREKASIDALLQRCGVSCVQQVTCALAPG